GRGLHQWPGLGCADHPLLLTLAMCLPGAAGQGNAAVEATIDTVRLCGPKRAAYDKSMIVLGGELRNDRTNGRQRRNRRGGWDGRRGRGGPAGRGWIARRRRLGGGRGRRALGWWGGWGGVLLRAAFWRG